MHVYGSEAFSPFNMPLRYEIVQLTPDNSNLALTRTKIDFPCISVIHLL